MHKLGMECRGEITARQFSRSPPTFMRRKVPKGILNACKSDGRGAALTEPEGGATTMYQECAVKPPRHCVT